MDKNCAQSSKIYIFDKTNQFYMGLEDRVMENGNGIVQIHTTSDLSSYVSSIFNNVINLVRGNPYSFDTQISEGDLAE